MTSLLRNQNDQTDGDGNVRRSNATSSTVQKPIGQLRHKSKYDDCYIFNYQEFESAKARPGSEHDVERLKHNFIELDFIVYTYSNKTKQETLDILKEAAKKDYKQSKCFVCCFLTHGKEGSLQMYDEELKVDDILECFSRSSCESLARKPKVFIFQACRGLSFEEAVMLRHDNDVDTDATVQGLPLSATRIPDYLDFLLVYSTYEGYVSFKTENTLGKEGNHGSFFIDELCRTLEQFSKNLDLLKILTIVNYRVANLFQSKSDCSKVDKKKQMPGFVSRLTTKVKFDKQIGYIPTKHTEYFDKRRKETELGVLSTERPLEDKKMYNIQKPSRVKFLFLVNMQNNFERDLLDSATSLWSTIAEKGYQSEVFSDWSEKELRDFLMEARSFLYTDCTICFIACQGEGEYLWDVSKKKFPKKNIIDQFTMCKTLAGKPKVFIFLMSAPTDNTRESCIESDGTDGDNNSTVPVHSDLLEIAFTFQESKQLKGVIGKLCDIFGSKGSVDLLSQLTDMCNELVESYGFYSPSSKNVATFCLNSTLTAFL